MATKKTFMNIVINISIIVHCLYSFPILGICQNKKAVSIGFSISPSSNFRNIDINNADPITFFKESVFDSLDEPRLSISYGLNINIPLYKKYSLELGLFYASRGHRIPFRQVYYTSGTDTLSQQSDEFKFHFFELPIILVL